MGGNFPKNGCALWFVLTVCSGGATSENCLVIIVVKSLFQCLKGAKSSENVNQTCPHFLVDPFLFYFPLKI